MQMKPIRLNAIMTAMKAHPLRETILFLLRARFGFPFRKILSYQGTMSIETRHRKIASCRFDKVRFLKNLSRSIAPLTIFHKIGEGFDSRSVPCYYRTSPNHG